MHEPNKCVLPRIGRFFLPFLFGNFFCTFTVWCQSHAASGIAYQGLRAEIDVTIHDASGEILSVPASVKVLHNGTPCDEGLTSNGRIAFREGNLGKFTVIVDSTGYESAQNDLNVAEPTRFQVEITLRRTPSSSLAIGNSGNPILAPKAQEAITSGMQALKDNNLQEAENYLDQAMKLAPNNPNVLYLRGLLDLKKHEWTKAQIVLEKSTQMEPNSARAWAALGMALCNQKKYALAIPALEKSLQVDPLGGWETHWSLAESYYRNARYAEALKASQQAQTDSNGEIPQVELLVAKALTAVGRYEDSANVLRELLKKHSEDPEAVRAKRYLERLRADGKIH